MPYLHTYELKRKGICVQEGKKGKERRDAGRRSLMKRNEKGPFQEEITQTPPANPFPSYFLSSCNSVLAPLGRTSESSLEGPINARCLPRVKGGGTRDQISDKGWDGTWAA